MSGKSSNLRPFILPTLRFSTLAPPLTKIDVVQGPRTTQDMWELLVAKTRSGFRVDPCPLEFHSFQFYDGKLPSVRRYGVTVYMSRVSVASLRSGGPRSSVAVVLLERFPPVDTSPNFPLVLKRFDFSLGSRRTTSSCRTRSHTRRSTRPPDPNLDLLVSLTPVVPSQCLPKPRTGSSLPSTSSLHRVLLYSEGDTFLPSAVDGSPDILCYPYPLD